MIGKGHRREDLTSGGRHSRVLVCNLCPDLQEFAESDRATYSRFYNSVQFGSFLEIDDLWEGIGGQCDIVHLFCRLLPDGTISLHNNRNVHGGELIDRCCRDGVKLLWIASDNPGDAYVRGLRAIGKPINLIMTIDRRGRSFSMFLDRFLHMISAGKLLPNAWVSLATQSIGSTQQNNPSCIFSAGAPGVALIA